MCRFQVLSKILLFCQIKEEEEEMKKRFFAVLTALALALTACGTGTAQEEKTVTETSAAVQAEAEETSSEAEPKELRKINIGYGAHLGCVLYFIAQEEGYFNDYGIEAELTMMDDSANGIAALKSGKFTLGSFGSNEAFSLISQGEEELTVFGGQMHEGSGLITLPENAEYFKDWENFRGKTLGMVRMSTGDIIFRGALHRAGLDLQEDVNIVELGSAPEVIESVKKGAIDVGAVWIPQLANAEAQGLEITCLSGEVAPNHP